MDVSINNFTEKYFSTFNNSLGKIVVSDQSNNKIDYSKAVEAVVELLKTVQQKNKKVMMVGNGGSAGICSHQVVDYWKNGNIKSTAFNDPSLLTCISNDYSYAEVFSKPIEMFGEEGDVVYCISSSGKSINILNAAKSAKEKKCTVITFSGFEENNPLLKEGLFNFYVPSNSYGFVEILHLFIIHSILDAKMYCDDRIDIFEKNLPLK
ncbi:MAG: SIS domain-containing protein [Bacteroidia bacterium]